MQIVAPIWATLTSSSQTYSYVCSHIFNTGLCKQLLIRSLRIKINALTNIWKATVSDAWLGLILKYWSRQYGIHYKSWSLPWWNERVPLFLWWTGIQNGRSKTQLRGHRRSRHGGDGIVISCGSVSLTSSTVIAEGFIFGKPKSQRIFSEVGRMSCSRPGRA